MFSDPLFMCKWLFLAEISRISSLITFRYDFFFTRFQHKWNLLLALSLWLFWWWFLVAGLFYYFFDMSNLRLIWQWTNYGILHLHCATQFTTQNTYTFGSETFFFRLIIPNEFALSVLDFFPINRFPLAGTQTMIFALVFTFISSSFIYFLLGTRQISLLIFIYLKLLWLRKNEIQFSVYTLFFLYCSSTLWVCSNYIECY